MVAVKVMRMVKFWIYFDDKADSLHLLWGAFNVLTKIIFRVIT